MSCSVSRGGRESVVDRMRQQLFGWKGHGLGRDVVVVLLLVVFARPRARLAVAGRTIEEGMFLVSSTWCGRRKQVPVQSSQRLGRGLVLVCCSCFLRVLRGSARWTWMGVGVDFNRDVSVKVNVNVSMDLGFGVGVGFGYG